MSVAAPQMFCPSTAPDAPPVGADFARVEVFDDPALVLDAWRDLSPEINGSFYQSETFLLACLENLAARENARPLFILARDEAGAPLALLPLGLFRFGPLRVAQFLGGKHANYNLGLFRAGCAFSSRDLASLLRTAARAVPDGLHLYRLVNLPLSWRGARNPLTLLPHRPAASNAYATRLAGDGEAFLAARLSADTRKKLRKKEKRLATMGALKYFRAASPQEAEQILEAYFMHKSRQGAGHVAREQVDATRDFYRALARGDVGQMMEFHALALDRRIVAALGAGRNGGRLQGMFISYETDPEIARSSPGDLLLSHVLRDACARSLSSFDLGIGEARYKNVYCDETEMLADVLFAPTALGQLAAPFFSFAATMKNAIKRDPRLFALVKKWRAR
jgi:CelD/BcsL family acetyltransferase involved in cellulose biosynthesis